MVALIDLTEGPRLMSTLIDVEPEDVAIGLPVRVDFAQWSEDISMPVFRIC